MQRSNERHRAILQNPEKLLASHGFGSLRYPCSLRRNMMIIGERSTLQKKRNDTSFEVTNFWSGDRSSIIWDIFPLSYKSNRTNRSVTMEKTGGSISTRLVYVSFSLNSATIRKVHRRRRVRRQIELETRECSGTSSFLFRVTLRNSLCMHARPP